MNNVIVLFCFLFFLFFFIFLSFFSFLERKKVGFWIFFMNQKVGILALISKLMSDQN